tara:strand:- start:431 stop:598 length:168 start_codon:yes stop_codon:yes gene_type:complete
MQNKKNSRRTFIKKIFTISFYPFILKGSFGILFINKDKILKKKFSKIWILNKNDY